MVRIKAHEVDGTRQSKRAVSVEWWPVLPGRGMRAAVMVLVALFGSSTLKSQVTGSGVEETRVNLDETIRDVKETSASVDRVATYSSIRIPESMIEIAPADQHVDLAVHNRFITTLRATVLAKPPAARASAIGEALRKLAASGRISPIETFSLEQGVLFVIADEPVLSITHKDLDLLVGETLDKKEAEVKANLEIALAEMVELRDVEALVTSVAKTLMALMVFALAFWLLQRAKRLIDEEWMPALDERMRASLVKRLGKDVEEELRVHTVPRALMTLCLWGVFLVIAYGSLVFSLGQFPYTRPWGESLGRTLLEFVGWMVGGVARAVPGVFVVLVILFLARMTSRLVRWLFAAVETGRVVLPGLHPDTAEPTRRIVTALIWLLALVVAYPYFPGSSSAAFKGLSVFTGLVISLGSTGIVNQAMSGMMLMYARALKAGDFVKIGAVEGTVTHLGMLSTKVRSLKNEEVTVPNAVVISRETVNYSRYEREGVAISTSVTIGYGTPWRQVHELLEVAAGMTRGLRSESKPLVLQTALSDYYPEYKLVAVIDQPATKGRVLSALHQNIQDLFNRNGIQIMSPHYVADPPEPITAPVEET